MTSPYSIYSADIVVIAEKLKTKLETAPAGTFDTPPSLEHIFYGDQDRIPGTPAICIEPSDKVRTIEGPPNMTLNEFEVFILVYHNKVQGNETTRQEVDRLAYQIERYLHQDLQLNMGVPLEPALIHGYCRSNESGYAYKAGTLYRSARITYYGKNKTSLAES